MDHIQHYVILLRVISGRTDFPSTLFAWIANESRLRNYSKAPYFTRIWMVSLHKGICGINAGHSRFCPIITHDRLFTYTRNICFDSVVLRIGYQWQQSSTQTQTTGLSPTLHWRAGLSSAITHKLACLSVAGIKTSESSNVAEGKNLPGSLTHSDQKKATHAAKCVTLWLVEEKIDSSLKPWTVRLVKRVKYSTRVFPLTSSLIHYSHTVNFL